MKLAEIESKVLLGELILEKTYMGKKTRRKYIWNGNGDIERVDKLEYDWWYHKAMYPGENKGYRIPKKSFDMLIKKLGK